VVNSAVIQVSSFKYRQQHHEQYLTEVIDWLHAHQFIVGNLTYHDILPLPVRQRLKQIPCPTTWSIRMREDRIVVHQILSIAFKLEVKTRIVDGSDFLLEALPVIFHWYEFLCGVQCLYVARYVLTGKEIGFWVQDIPKLATHLYIPYSRQDNQLVMEIINKIPGFWNELPTYTVRSRGSGTPFFRLDGNRLSQCEDWRDIILKLLRSFHFIPRLKASEPPIPVRVDSFGQLCWDWNSNLVRNVEG
jgi:hypothetical protein